MYAALSVTVLVSTFLESLAVTFVFDQLLQEPYEPQTQVGSLYEVYPAGAVDEFDVVLVNVA